MRGRGSFGWVAALMASALVMGLDLAGANPTRDGFGGQVPAISVASGFFQVVRRDARDVLVTPAGDPLWLREVYGVDWSGGGAEAARAFSSNYGGQPFRFAQRAAERLQAWGFNALGPYASAYALPVPTYYRPSGNPVKLPFVLDANISWYGAINAGGLAPGAFKTLLAGAVDPGIYRGWAGNVPDVFDPNFALYAQAAAADRATATHPTVFTEATVSGGDPQPSLVDSPWLLATVADDSDDVFGFGPGPEMPGADGTVQPNVGWVVAVTKPQQRENAQVGAFLGSARTVRYSDPTVYAKAAWVSYLESRYHTIQALNAAWGANYTTFGSDGGWPAGRGVLDESGRHAWLGTDPAGLGSAAPAAAKDMNAFLGLYAERYYRITSAALRAAMPHQLVFSGVLDTWGGLSRPEVLRAAARSCDVLEVAIGAEQSAVAERTYALTHKPMVANLILRADGDSGTGGQATAAAGEFSTQAARGAAYGRALAWVYGFKTSGAGGVHPFIGISWWEYMDKAGERANFGLVTALDNAYDGRQDRVAPGRTGAGFAIGGERGNYGDFLGAVAAANQATDADLAQALRPAPARARSGGKDEGHGP